MRVTPKSEKEIAEANLLPKGIYGFEIADAVDTTSKAGNDMIALKIKVFSDAGYQFVNDYLLDAIPHKVRHCAEVCGVLDDYERGELHAANLIGKTGNLKLGIQADKTGAYPDRNSVMDYIKPDAVSEFAKTSARTPAMADALNDLDDEIPF